MGRNHRILECRELRKSYGDLVAVNGISFHIAEGETYGLLGPNGAGKTTTISMICGLLERDTGEVLIDGVELTPRSVAVKAGIGYVPQELAIYPDLTPNPPKDTDGRREDSGRGWVRELQGRWPGVLG